MSIVSFIFDAEGVVIDTTTIWDVAQEGFLSTRGISYDRATIKPMLSGRDIFDSTRVLIEHFQLDGSLDELVRERREGVRNAIRGEVRFIPGAVDFIAGIQKRYSIAMATALDPDLFDVADEKLGLLAMFGGNVTTMRDVGGRGKPDPALFLHAANRLHSPAKQCIVVEDAPLGVDAAIAADMKCIAITTTYSCNTLSKANIIVDSFEILSKLMDI